MTKLNFFLSKFLLLSIVFLTFTQCEKRNNGLVPTVKSSNELTKNDNTITESFRTNANFHKNELNSFDAIGELHNQGLDYYIKNVANPQNTSISEIFNVCGGFATSVGFPSELVNQATSPTFINYWTNFQRSSNKNNFLLSGGYISQKMYEALSEMNLILDGCSINNQEQVIASLKALELRLINNEFGLSEREKGVLLASTSVGRHSLIYWSKQISTKGTWIRDESSITNAKVSDIVKSDVGGAVAGGIIGAITGGTVTIAFGGIGSVPAWGAGVVLGGAGASIAQGVEQLWSWYWN